MYRTSKTNHRLILLHDNVQQWPYLTPEFNWRHYDSKDQDHAEFVGGTTRGSASALSLQPYLHEWGRRVQID